MEGGIIVFNGVDKVAYRDLGIQFFPDLSFQCLLRGFTRLDFAARKLLLTLVVTITAGGSVDFALFLHGVADHSGHNTNRFHNVLLLDSLGRPSEVPPTR